MVALKFCLTFGICEGREVMGIPMVLFDQYGYFDEYDYWAGTASLVVFASLETILFAWIFGMDKD